VGPQPSTVESTQISESVYNQQSVNNIAIREGSPEYMVASADGTEVVSQRSGKKRRRCEMIGRNNLYVHRIYANKYYLILFNIHNT